MRHFWGVGWRRLFLKVTRIASARPLGGTARLGAPQTKSTAWGFMDKLKDTNLACQCIQGLAYGYILRERSASPPHSVKPPKQLSLMSPQGGAGLLLSHPDPEGTIWGPTCMWGRCPIRFLTLSRLCVLSFVHVPLWGTQAGDTWLPGACVAPAVLEGRVIELTPCHFHLRSIGPNKSYG